MPVYGDSLCEICSRPLLDQHTDTCSPAPWMDGGDFRTSSAAMWMGESCALYPDGALVPISMGPLGDAGQVGAWHHTEDANRHVSFEELAKLTDRVYGVHRACCTLFGGPTDAYHLIDTYWCDDATLVSVVHDAMDQMEESTRDVMFSGEEYEGQFYALDKAHMEAPWLLEEPVPGTRLHDTIIQTKDFLLSLKPSPPPASPKPI